MLTTYLNGAGGNDTLVGNDGIRINCLNGGAGDDILIGGAGNDLMNGGINNDTFVFGAGFGADTISQFDADAGNAGTRHARCTRLLGINAANFDAQRALSPTNQRRTLVTINAAGNNHTAGCKRRRSKRHNATGLYLLNIQGTVGTTVPAAPPHQLAELKIDFIVWRRARL